MFRPIPSSTCSFPDGTHAIDQSAIRRGVSGSRGLCCRLRALAQCLWVSSPTPMPGEKRLCLLKWLVGIDPHKFTRALPANPYTPRRAARTNSGGSRAFTWHSFRGHAPGGLHHAVCQAIVAVALRMAALHPSCRSRTQAVQQARAATRLSPGWKLVARRK